MRFRSLPVEVDAIEWRGDNADELVSFTRGQFNALDDEDRANCDDPDATAQLFDRRGMWRLVFDGDWIVREGGQFYVCRPEAFSQQFEQVPGAVVKDHLYDELLKPVAEDYYTLAGEIVASGERPGTAGWAARAASMDTLESCGNRIARVLDVAAPLWEDMRAMAGLTW